MSQRLPRAPTLRTAGAVGRATFVLLLAAAVLLPAGGARAAAPAFETQTFAYTPPDRAPKGMRSRYVDEAPDIVFARVWTFLEESGLAIASVDPQQRIVVAQYDGDPRSYVDCGVVTPLVDGVPDAREKPFTAAKPELRTAKTVNKRRYGLLREMGLHVRLMVRVEPRGRGARIYSEAIYVATKSLRRVYQGGRPGELLDREVISFRSDGQGQFTKGTVCIGTGKLEALPLALFKKTS